MSCDLYLIKSTCSGDCSQQIKALQNWILHSLMTSHHHFFPLFLYPNHYRNHSGKSQRWPSCVSHVEPETFPVTPLSHHHLTSIIGLLPTLLFIYFSWQANRGEVRQSHGVCRLGVVCVVHGKGWGQQLGRETSLSHTVKDFCIEDGYNVFNRWVWSWEKNYYTHKKRKLKAFVCVCCDSEDGHSMAEQQMITLTGFLTDERDVPQHIMPLSLWLINSSDIPLCCQNSEV